MLIELLLIMPFYLRYRKVDMNVGIKPVLVLIGVVVLNMMQQLGFLAISFHAVMAHVYLLASMSGCLQLLLTILICRPTHVLERIGLMMAISGVLVMLADPHAIKDGEKVNVPVELMALLINIPWFIYFVGL